MGSTRLQQRPDLASNASIARGLNMDRGCGDILADPEHPSSPGSPRLSAREVVRKEFGRPESLPTFIVTPTSTIVRLLTLIAVGILLQERVDVIFRDLSEVGSSSHRFAKPDPPTGIWVRPLLAWVAVGLMALMGWGARACRGPRAPRLCFRCGCGHGCGRDGGVACCDWCSDISTTRADWSQFEGSPMAIVG